MRLSKLAAALPQVLKHSGPAIDPEIARIVYDSREVSPEDLFVAVRGTRDDGHRYLGDALQRGAVALVVETPPAKTPAPTLVVPDSRKALAHLAAAWHGYPSLHMRIVGVTGTDGKTTTASMIRSIFQRAGYPTGLITSVGADVGGREIDTGLHTTTPNAPQVQALLAEMVTHGCEYAVLEATSHGLAQERLEACHFDVAVLTNLTHEHLDYHGTFAKYRAAKGRLFEYLSVTQRKSEVLKVAVINADDPSAAYFEDYPADLQLAYGLREPAQVMAANMAPTPNGIRFEAFTPSGDFPLELPLPGEFNVRNALASIAVAISQNIDPPVIQEALRRFPGVVGRLERIALEPFRVIIDFAHTPHALEQALQAVRPMGAGKLWVVFGCAGLRDREKRPVMGESAGRLADRVVITAEDPRTESLEEICAQIEKGCRRAGRVAEADYWIIGDRAQAIGFAIEKAQPGDLVLITGKGHEKSMCFGTSEYPWSDHEVAREALARLKT